MGIKVNEKDYSWGEVAFYAFIVWAVYKTFITIFGSSNSDCIKFGMKEYGYSRSEAEEACDEATFDSQIH